MPLFAPSPAKAQSFKLSSTRAAQLAAMRGRRVELQAMGERWRREREAPALQEAMRLLNQETVAALPDDSLKLILSSDVIDHLSRE